MENGLRTRICLRTNDEQTEGERDNLRTMTPIVELTCWKLKSKEERLIRCEENLTSPYASFSYSKRAHK